jgi:hypothetical protein
VQEQGKMIAKIKRKGICRINKCFLRISNVILKKNNAPKNCTASINSKQINKAVRKAMPSQKSIKYQAR